MNKLYPLTLATTLLIPNVFALETEEVTSANTEVNDNLPVTLELEKPPIW